MKNVHEFHQQYPNKAKSIIHGTYHYKGKYFINDAIDVNAMKFIHRSVHP
jgi:hypothetical protein